MIKTSIFKKLSAIAILVILSAAFVNLAAAEQAGSGGKILNLAGLQRGNDFNDIESDYCFQRSVQGDNVVIFWHKEHGDDPLNHPNPDISFDVKQMHGECERYYKTYVDVMKMVEKGNSVSDKYKLVVFVREGEQGAAYGGGSGDVASLNTPAARVHNPPYGVLAHEMVHCFQHMSRQDGHGGGGVNAEMGAQHGLWQNLPEWMTFENYHLVDFMNQTHLAFDHSSNMYHTAHVMEYWAFKRGRDIYGQMLRSGERGDSVTCYKNIFSLTQEQFNDEMFDAYRRFMTWDIPRIEKVANQYANQHHTTLNKADDGWYRIDKSKCPQNYGYNGIKLKVPEAGTNVVLNFKGIAGTEGFSNLNTELAGWRYGFVAYLKDGKRIYGNVGKNPQDALAFQVPENTEYLWLVVMGAPTEHPSRASGRGGGFGGGRRARTRNAIARQVVAISELNLKEEQISKLNDMPVADANIANAVTEAQTALNAAIVTADEAKIKDAVKNVVAATEKNSLAQAAEYKKIKGILSEEQYEQMTASLTSPRGGRGGSRGGQSAGSGQAEWPYQVKLTGTTIDDSAIQ